MYRFPLPKGIFSWFYLPVAFVYFFGTAQADVRIVPPAGHTGSVSKLVFSADGAALVSGSESGELKLWSTRTGQLLRTMVLEGESQSIEAIALSPDSKWIASAAGEPDFVIWDTSTGNVAKTFSGNDSPVSVLAITPDGTHIISGSYDGIIKIWDAASAKVLHTLNGHTAQIIEIAVFSDGHLASGSADGQIKLWQLENATELSSIDTNNDGSESFAFSRDGTLAAVSGQTVTMWDLRTGALLRTFGESSKEGDSSRTVVLSPDNEMVAIGYMGLEANVRAWDARTGTLLHQFKEQKFNYPYKVSKAVAFSPNGSMLAVGGSDKTPRLLNSRTFSLLQSMGDLAVVPSLSISPDGDTLILGSEDFEPQVGSMLSGQMTRQLPSEGFNSSYDVAFSPDGRTLLTRPLYGELQFWSTKDYSRTHAIKGTFGSNVFTPDGSQILATSCVEDGDGMLCPTLTLLGTSDGREIWSRTESTFGEGIDVSPDGKSAVICHSHAPIAEILDLKTGASKDKLQFEGDSCAAAKFSPDGRLVAVGGWKTGLVVWDASSARAITTIKDVAEHVQLFRFTRDGGGVLAADGNSVGLWNTKTGAKLLSFAGHADTITAILLALDGRRFLTASRDGTVRIWHLEKSEPLATIFPKQASGWLSMTPQGFFSATRSSGSSIGIVSGLEVYGVDQIWQSLYAPDLVRQAIANDPHGEVAIASTIISLDKVLSSGREPLVEIKLPAIFSDSKEEVITAEASVIAQDGGGIGRIEWRVNGITAGVTSVPANAAGSLTVTQTLALDPGQNTIEVVAYNAKNLVASVPAIATVTWSGSSPSSPRLHILAIGINKYIDKGGIAPGTKEAGRFPPLGLAVPDARAVADEFKKAGKGLYREVIARTVLDEEATVGKLNAAVSIMAEEIGPRDTFILYAAAHGYSHQDRFYLIPQDYQGGPDPKALTANAIDQSTLQDWVANKVRAKRVIVLLDTCESGALTSGYRRSRFDGAASDASIGRLHEATGRPILTAAGLGQAAIELTELGHGVFTSALIDSLYRGDANSDGTVSLSELVMHTQNLVPKLITDPNERAEIIRRGSLGDVQSARFGGRGEDFPLVQGLK